LKLFLSNLDGNASTSAGGKNDGGKQLGGVRRTVRG